MRLFDAPIGAKFQYHGIDYRVILSNKYTSATHPAIRAGKKECLNLKTCKTDRIPYLAKIRILSEKSENTEISEK